MAQNNFFVMRVKPADRAIFEELAHRLGRSQSYSLKKVAHDAVIVLRDEEAKKLSLIPQPAEGATA